VPNHRGRLTSRSTSSPGAGQLLTAADRHVGGTAKYPVSGVESVRILATVRALQSHSKQVPCMPKDERAPLTNRTLFRLPNVPTYSFNVGDQVPLYFAPESTEPALAIDLIVEYPPLQVPES
jgi:hypothetical protein